jgi:cytochrome c-type biogenesis protein CcmH/NrfF
LKSVRKAFLVIFLVSSSLSFAADKDRVDHLSQQLMCPCGGCNTTLGFCPHKLECGSGVGMKKELAEMVDQGKDDKTILAAFAEKYGAAILSAPPASGFNLAAWLMPFFALGFGAVVAVYLVRRFSARWSPAAPGSVDTAKYQTRVEEELRKFTPED